MGSGGLGFRGSGGWIATWSGRTDVSCGWTHNIGVQGTGVQARFRVQGSGFRVQGSGFRGSGKVQGSGFRGSGKVQGAGYRVQGSRFRAQGSWFRVQGTGFRVQAQGSGLRAQGSGSRFMSRAQGSGLRVQGSGYRHTRHLVSTQGISASQPPQTTPCVQRQPQPQPEPPNMPSTHTYRQTTHLRVRCLLPCSADRCPRCIAG